MKTIASARGWTGSNILVRLAEMLEQYGVDCAVDGDYLTDGSPYDELMCKESQKAKELLRKLLRKEWERFITIW